METLRYLKLLETHRTAVVIIMVLVRGIVFHPGATHLADFAVFYHAHWECVAPVVLTTWQCLMISGLLPPVPPVCGVEMVTRFAVVVPPHIPL